MLNAAVSAGYYLRVVGVIFFRTPLATPRTREEPGLSLLATALCVLLVLAIGIMPGYWGGSALRAIPARPKSADGRGPVGAASGVGSFDTPVGKIDTVHLL